MDERQKQCFSELFSTGELGRREEIFTQRIERHYFITRSAIRGSTTSTKSVRNPENDSIKVDLLKEDNDIVQWLDRVVHAA